MVDLSCTVAGVRFPNPLTLASGVWGTSPALLERAARSGAGAVTAKSASPEARRGHRNPTAVDWGGGLLNAMGLPNPGCEEEVGMLQEARRLLAPLGVPLIASIFAQTVEGFGRAAETVDRAGPDLIEVNISCPNVAHDCGEPFAASREAAAAATRAVKAATRIPVTVKLSPAVASIASIASAVEEAGADAITAVNTMPGMLIDAESGRPVLANATGGLSGAALKPIALRCVWEIARAVRIPIIGTGGVLCGLDAVEMIQAGATAVGIGSAVYYGGGDCFRAILEGLRSWMEARGRGSLEEIRGSALRPPAPGADGAPATNPPPYPSWREP